MESLLRQLAGDHPPGPMPGTTDTTSTTGKKSDLSPEDEEKAFQRAIEMMLSTEGMAAMGLDDKDPLPSPSKKPQPPKPSTSKPRETTGSKPDVSAFEETIRKAMESLNSAGGPAAGGSGGAGGPSDPAELAKLLASLGNDPNLDLEGDDDLSGILDGMMGQLMTREVLEEPLSELASKVSSSMSYSRAKS
jgi:peroxin-19